MILMIDNYDSFTFNIVQYLGQMGENVQVYRNDKIKMEEIRRLKPQAIFLSPGPCTPREAGITVDVIREFYKDVPIMGICLGHQSIGYAFGAEVVRASRIMHGKTSPIINDGKTIFAGLPNPFSAGRYHSLLVARETLPACLEISAETAEGEIMGLRHKEYPVEGIQFHPESVLTPQGKRIIKKLFEIYRTKGASVMIKEAIEKAVNKTDLREAEMMAAMDEIMEGIATPAQIAALITALRMKGETVEEVTGAARIMRQKATRVNACATTIVDTCGTGGDKLNTFNISTTAAFVVAAAGIVVAKHGNRAVSSGCGSADVLEALGVNISAGQEIVEECIQQIGIGFLFAPKLHGAMKYAIGPRREIGIRTIFNMLGPLTNPAGATAQLLGVYDPKLTEMFADVLKNMGTKRAFVVHGLDGLDEVTITGETRVAELKDGIVRTYNINPMDYFGRVDPLEAIRGGDPTVNAQITRDVLSGKNGACRNVVLINAALAIVAGEKAQNIKEGIKVAADCIDSGAAVKKLQSLIEMSNS